jgi:hypothetical protein
MKIMKLLEILENYSLDADVFFRDCGNDIVYTIDKGDLPYHEEGFKISLDTDVVVVLKDCDSDSDSDTVYVIDEENSKIFLFLIPVEKEYYEKDEKEEFDEEWYEEENDEFDSEEN